MGCHAPSEEVEDDQGEFPAAAGEDVTLVAKLLMRLSRSEPHIPWRHLRESTQPRRPLSGVMHEEPPTWGARRLRSGWITTEGVLAAKREDASRASPSTPLSWSGGSGTSGSVCGDVWSAPPRPLKRRKQPIPDENGGETRRPSDSSPAAKAGFCHDAERVPSSPELYENRCQDPGPAPTQMKMETVYEDGEPRVALLTREPGVGSSSGSGSNKAAVVRDPPQTPAARVEPLRLRLTGEGTASVVVRRPGKKKTLPELKALKESLSLEQVELRKELEKQRKIHESLLEENMKLKSLESSFSSHAIGESEQPQCPLPCSKFVSTEQDETEQLQCTTRSSPCEPRRGFLLDLNCPPADDL